MTNEELKDEILKLTREYSRRVHKSNRPGSDPSHPHNSDEFQDDDVSVPYAGRVFDEHEVEAAVSATLDFWLTLGKEGDKMSEKLASFLGVKKCLLVNSGSSANLIAVSTITTHKLPPHKRLMKGDEVITCAAGFPTTVAPIIQCGAKPVFIDNCTKTANARADQLEAAYIPGKTKAVMFAHTLGNPFDLTAVLEFCTKYDLWLIEDNCDALGCTYTLPVTKAKEIGLQHLLNIADKDEHPIIKYSDDKTLITAPTGCFGDISTQSFYPPHHLTMGEGGSVNIVRRLPIAKYAESFRDWGRDCWCPSGIDNTCQKRFGWSLGELPKGYDHKYIYSHLGFNVKPLDPQAAIGVVQMSKLNDFVEARKKNWTEIRTQLADLEDYFDFSLPTHAKSWDREKGFIWENSDYQVDCSWFGFMLSVKPSSPFTASEFAQYLTENKIGNRMLFGGNLTRQPAFVQLRADYPDAYRVVGELEGADSIMNNAVFIGTYPGMTTVQLAKIGKTVHTFIESING
ncbi:MAG: lipopolysaccharide biosynthesis protein RfbH [Opitutales bacterium]|nr:lipopolysaccharide biosynthesis protein RfbH [Opitutales bacterium]